MDLSEHISQLAEEYDPVREHDAQLSRALIQGALFGHVAGDSFREFISVGGLEQERDDDGNYLPYFVIVTGAGHRIRISVEVEQ